MNKLLPVEFQEIEHYGNVMEQVRQFERELEAYNNVIFGREETPIQGPKRLKCIARNLKVV